MKREEQQTQRQQRYNEEQRDKLLTQHERADPHNRLEDREQLKRVLVNAELTTEETSVLYKRIALGNTLEEIDRQTKENARSIEQRALRKLYTTAGNLHARDTQPKRQPTEKQQSFKQSMTNAVAKATLPSYKELQQQTKKQAKKIKAIVQKRERLGQLETVLRMRKLTAEETAERERESRRQQKQREAERRELWLASIDKEGAKVSRSIIEMLRALPYKKKRRKRNACA